MKQQWSKKWVGSKQPRKQRKYRYNAPLHAKHKFLSATLSKTLRSRFGRRSLQLRVGDEVEVLRGSAKKMKGKIEKVDLKKGKIYVEGIKVKKVDGTDTGRGLQPSNLRIISLNLDDKKRLQKISKKAGTKVDAEPAKIETKEVN